MYKLAPLFAPFLISACVTINKAPDPSYQQTPVQYAVFQMTEDGNVKDQNPVIKNSHFPYFPPVEDDACDAGCKSACKYIYGKDDYKYHDCVSTQRYWLTPRFKPRSLSDGY